jgi:uncharacterized protein (TIGR02453 family)
MAPAIKKETIQFLKDLKKNNNRDWFTANKDRFVAANDNFIDFIQALILEISKFDKSVIGLDAKKCVFRIYRDTRFSKDKSPYKSQFGAVLMGKGEGCEVAGYYLHLEPGGSFLAGGVHMTEPANFKAIREEISGNGKAFLKIINDKTFKEYFTIEGERLQKVPQGFDKEDPMGEYLKYKALMLQHKVNDKEITSDGYVKYCAARFKAMVPFNNFVNEPVRAL